MFLDHSPSPSRRLTILATAFKAVGHMNGVAGATKSLIERGHRMIFLVETSFSNRFHPLGFEEHVYSYKPEASASSSPTEQSGEWLAKFLLKQKIIGPATVEEKMASLIDFVHSPEHLAEWTAYNQAVKEALELYKPDLVYYDYGALVPALYYSKIPWIRNFSIAPSSAINWGPPIPPGGSGFSSKSDPNSWIDFTKLGSGLTSSPSWQAAFIEALGFPPYPGNFVYPETQLLTVYAYPKELNYPKIAQKPDWFNLEVFHRDPIDQEVQLTQLIPESFMLDTLKDGKFTGKYIYLSLGSMGSVDLSRMNRLVSILSNSNHKYIISKGLRSAEYQLGPNMWGEPYLPQTKLLSHVDLVITHGGNNTVTETFAIGKPMIILPLFGDQFDNATRIDEQGFGIRLNPYEVEESQLLGAIDRLLYDEQLAEKLEKASKRIRDSKRHEELALKIEELVESVL